MLGLPKVTECREQIAKHLIFKTLILQRGDRAKMDAAFRRLDVVNILHPQILNISPGKRVKSIYVLQVELGSYDYDQEVVALLPTYIRQNMILTLSFQDKLRLAVLHKGQFYQWPYWKNAENAKLDLNGITLDEVWENFVSQIGSLGEGSENLDVKIRKKQLEEEIKKLRIRIRGAKNKAPLFAQLQAKQKELEQVVDGRE